MSELTPDQRLAALESTMREYSETADDPHMFAAAAIQKLRLFLNTDVMQKPEIEECIGRARDLIEAGTVTDTEEIFIYLEIIGGLMAHVPREAFDQVMVSALHEAHQSLVYEMKDEENGDWHV